MPKTPALLPKDQFPKQAIDESVVKQPKPSESSGDSWSLVSQLTIGLAIAADKVTPWGRAPKVRDQQLRDFWPTEPNLAGAVVNVSFRNATLDWEVQATSRVEQAVTDMLTSALAGDLIGWVPFVQKFSQDLYTTDNGGFIELIRDPVMNAGSRFQGPRAPVIGIGHLDSGQCTRTGNAEFPIIYKDKDNREHKLAWYQVIPFSDFPSSIERMHGIGYCAVTRTLRLAQIMRSIEIYKDEKISGRHSKAIHIVGGIGRVQLDDATKRTHENADNQGQIRYIEPIIVASLDPEKPVSVATIDLASLPDGFDFDQEMQWYISGLALGFGVDYQEFAPLPGGNIGSSQQSMILHRKTSGKSPAIFMRTITEAFRNYGVIPRSAKFFFNDKNEQEELERQEVRTKAMEEVVMGVNAGVLSPAAARKDLEQRGIYDEKILSMIPEEYGEDRQKNSSYVERGGNTIAEDAGRQDTGKIKPRAGDRLRKLLGVKS